MYIYVSENGNDSSGGTKEFPLSSLEAAFEKITSSDDASYTVILADGTYRTGGIYLKNQKKKIRITSDGNAVINGGVRLSPSLFRPLDGCEKARLHGDAKEKVLCADLAALGLSHEDFGGINAVGTYHTAAKYTDGKVGPIWCELFVDDKRMELARYPDNGYLSSREVVSEGYGLETHDQQRRKDWDSVINPKGDVFAIDRDTSERVGKWKSLDDVWIFGYPRYGWADASTPIESFDRANGHIAVRYVSLFGMRERLPYYFFNVFEELDIPGEWYLDRNNAKLYIYPPDNFENADICLSLMTSPLITAENCDNLTFDNLTFMGTRGDAFYLSGNSNTVENCTFKNVGGYAMIIEGSRNTVSGCEIKHTGRGGIRISGGDRNTLKSSECLITGNHIHHIAEIYRTYQPAVSMSGVGVVCSHNCIHHSSHMAIGFSGNDHVMEYNEIYEVCLIADDSSAIYAGRDYTTCGNIIRYNFFHDMRSEADSHIGIFGTYCDDNLGETAIIGNIYLRCQSALLLHGGHDITFKNNLIVGSCPKSQYSVRFHPYGYWNDLLENGTHAANLAKVPWQGEIWRARYPHIAEYLKWDPETEQRFPHYCIISENIIIDHKPLDIRFDCHEARFHNCVRNNTELREYDGVSVSGDGTLSVDNDRLCALNEGFMPLPFDKMGIRK